MAKGKPKMLKFIDNLKKGYNSLLGKELAGALNKKAVSAVGMIPTFKTGGRVPKTGKALVHKGEVVLSVAKVKKLKKLMK